MTTPPNLNLLFWVLPVLYLCVLARAGLYWAVREQSRLEYWILGFIFDRSRSVRWRFSVWLTQIILLYAASFMFAIIVQIVTR